MLLLIFGTAAIMYTIHYHDVLFMEVRSITKQVMDETSQRQHDTAQAGESGQAQGHEESEVTQHTLERSRPGPASLTHTDGGSDVPWWPDMMPEATGHVKCRSMTRQM